MVQHLAARFGSADLSNALDSGGQPYSRMRTGMGGRDPAELPWTGISNRTHLQGAGQHSCGGIRATARCPAVRPFVAHNPEYTLAVNVPNAGRDGAGDA